MDKPPPPTASELGISDGEYERMMRDIRRFRGERGPADERPGPWRLFLVLGLVVVLVFGVRFAASRLVEPEPVHSFLQTVDGRPVTYSSCRLIQVAVYPAGGPPDAEQLVREAVSRMRTATGLDIVVSGAFGGHAPNWNFEASPVRPDDPISVSWQDGDAIANLTEHTAGLGGSRVMTGPAGTPHYVAGTIALSRDYYQELDERGEHGKALAVLLHEFGHVFGLDHVDSRRELMEGGGGGVTSFGPGDLEGLRLLGQGPCI